MQEREDVPYTVSHMKDDVFQAWTAESEASRNANQAGFIYAETLLGIRTILEEEPLISESDLIQAGKVNQELLKQFKVYQKNIQSQLEDADISSSLMDMQRELNNALARLAKEEVDSVGPGTIQPHLVVKRLSTLAMTRIGPSASSKLNYIINEVTHRIIYPPITIFTNPLLLGSKIFSRRKNPHLLRISVVFGSHR